MPIVKPRGIGKMIKSMSDERRAALAAGPAAASRFHRTIRTAFCKQYGYRFKDEPSFEEALSIRFNTPVGVCLETVDFGKFSRGLHKASGLVDTIRDMRDDIAREDRCAVFFRMSHMTTPWVAVIGEPPTVKKGNWNITIYTGGSFPNLHLLPFPAFARQYGPVWSNGELVPEDMGDWFIGDDEEE